jgi:hypothetical protein
LYLKGEASLSEYNVLIESVTRHFSSISKEIIELSKSIEKPYQILICQIQQLEKQNLELTVQLQELRTESELGERDFTDDCKILEDKVYKVRREIGQVLEDLHCEVADAQVNDVMR